MTTCLLTTHHFYASFWVALIKHLRILNSKKKYEKRGAAPEIIIAAGAIAENTYFFKFYLDKFHHREKFVFDITQDFPVSNLNMVFALNLLPVEHECEVGQLHARVGGNFWRNRKRPVEKALHLKPIIIGQVTAR